MGKSTKKKLKNKVKKEKKKVKVAVAKENLAKAVTKIAGHGAYSSKLSAPEAMSLKRAIRGSGGYASDLVNTVSGAAAPIAGLIDGVGKLFGFGDYEAGANHLQAAYDEGNSLKSAFPETEVGYGQPPDPGRMLGNGTAKFDGPLTTVTHRELVDNVLGSGSFATTLYDINPGATAGALTKPITPWLAEIAKGFQQYALMGMIFEYISATGNVSTTGQLGTVYMSTQYDSDAKPLGTQQAVADTDFTTTNTATKNFIHPIECAPGSNAITWRYLDNTNSTSTDSRWNDYGSFQVSTIGFPTDLSNQVVGQLYITYKVGLKKPRLSGNSGSYWSALLQAQPGNPLGMASVSVPDEHSTLNMSIMSTSTAGSWLLRFPNGTPGNFQISLANVSSPFTPTLASSIALASDSTVSPLNYMPDMGAAAHTPPDCPYTYGAFSDNSGDGYTSNFTGFVTVTGEATSAADTLSITVSGGYYASAIIQAEEPIYRITVTQVPDDLTTPYSSTSSTSTRIKRELYQERHVISGLIADPLNKGRFISRADFIDHPIHKIKSHIVSNALTGFQGVKVPSLTTCLVASPPSYSVPLGDCVGAGATLTYDVNTSLSVNIPDIPEEKENEPPPTPQSNLSVVLINERAF